MEIFKKYLEEKELARDAAQSLIGKTIYYTWSGNLMTGEVVRVHEMMDQLWVLSRTGKSYYIFWSAVHENH